MRAGLFARYVLRESTPSALSTLLSTLLRYADKTENILWRLANGELDGVNPKVIVILAGTHNVGTQPGGAAKVAEITRGLAAIVSVCRPQLMGHANVDTTLNVYTQVLDGSLRSAVEKVGGELFAIVHLPAEAGSLTR